MPMIRSFGRLIYHILAKTGPSCREPAQQYSQFAHNLAQQALYCYTITPALADAIAAVLLIIRAVPVRGAGQLDLTPWQPTTGMRFVCTHLCQATIQTAFLDQSMTIQVWHSEACCCKAFTHE